MEKAKTQLAYELFKGCYKESEQWALPDFETYVAIMEDMRKKGVHPHKAVATMMSMMEMILRIGTAIDRACEEHSQILNYSKN